MRGVNLEINIPPNLDEDIIGGSRGTAIPPTFLNSGLSSHVLLAACGAGETAKENSNRTRGAFTEALLDTLRSVGPEKVTYKDLILRLPTLSE